ncbi:restriction endonuclease subunit S [Pontiellaceae bacterium B12227]|nr:restriction endonuclease subunit S [Pontiellaceae bacterium B12227]
MVETGYKQTELGVIPEDWEVKPLGRLISSVEYGSSAKSNSRGHTPVLRMGNLQGGRIDWGDLVYTNDEAERKKYSLSIGDVLFNRTNTVDLVGKTAIYIEEYPAIFAGYLIRIKVDATLLNAFFLNYVMNTNFAKKHSAKVLSVAVGQANINSQKLKTYPIPIPPTLAEQEAIAGALSDVDELVGSLEKLIVKKRAIKTGAMQQLLTGKQRLPGFDGEWKLKSWGEVTDKCTSGATPYRGQPDFYKGNIKWISSGELNYNTITDTVEHISAEAVKKANLQLHPIGTFLIAITGLEAAGTRGSCGIVGSPATTNQSCMAIYPTSELLTEYLYHYYVYRGDELALQYCQGTKQMSYTAKIIRILPIHLPPTIDEQQAIAEVLSDMDTEIQALETKLSKTKAIRQGMMQELLTGKVRLI